MASEDTNPATTNDYSQEKEKWSFQNSLLEDRKLVEFPSKLPLRCLWSKLDWMPSCVPVFEAVE